MAIMDIGVSTSISSDAGTKRLIIQYTTLLVMRITGDLREGRLLKKNLRRSMSWNSYRKSKSKIC